MKDSKQEKCDSTTKWLSAMSSTDFQQLGHVALRSVKLPWEKNNHSCKVLTDIW